MATLLSSGTSTKLDSFTAGREATLSALYRLEKNKPSILITFISTIYDQKETLKGVRSVIKDTNLIGCSSPATITSNGIFKDSVSVYAISSSSVSFACGIGKEINKNPRLSSHNASKVALKASKDTTKIYMMLSDGLSANGTDLLRGAQEILGTSFPIIGGLAIDNFLFERSFQYINNNILVNSIVGLLINGDINIERSDAHGWQGVGKPQKVTRAKSNIIKEINKERASKIYEDYFEKSLDELKKEGIATIGINYPLGIKSKLKKDYLTRPPIALEEDGSLRLNAEIAEGEDINIMFGDRNTALEATKKACIEALAGVKTTNINFVAIFSDIARLKLLRSDAKKEIELIKGLLGDNIPIMGCYTCGEFAQSYFNNTAISIAIFSEAERKDII